MNILVNLVTNLRPPKFKKSSILTPCFQILGNTLLYKASLMYQKKLPAEFEINPVRVLAMKRTSKPN